jgi:sarcosine oxidase subunit gamma
MGSDSVAELDSTMTLTRSPPDASSLVRPGLGVLAERGLGIGKIQVLGTDPDAVLRRLAGFEPPSPCAQVERQGLHCAWLSPNEWLLTGPEREVADMLMQIDARGADEVLAVDLTHARASFVINGTDARDVLASLCPLDFWSEAFPVHAVARSLLGDAGMFVARLPDLTDVPRFRIIVDQTMAAYAARVLASSQSRP